MNKLLYSLILIFAAGSAFAQIDKMPKENYIGINYGYGISGVAFQPSIKGSATVGSFNAGIAFKHRGEKYVGFEANINYVNRGYKIKSQDIDSTYKRSFNSIMVPVMAQGTIAYKRVIAIIDLGAYAAYRLDSEVEIDVNGVKTKEDYEFIVDRDRRYEFGALAGAGFYIDLRPILVQFDARYYYGLTNLINPNYVNNKPLESRPYQWMVTASIFYRLGGLTKKTK